MKKRLLSAALAVMILALFAYGTTAYINAEGRATNVITTGELKMSLTEESGEGIPIENEQGVVTGLKFENVVPSQTVEKKPIVTNEGTQDFYLRVRIEKSFSDPNLSADVIETDGPDSAHWIAGKDGWYYYNVPLTAGDSAVVFEHVTFSPQMGNEYQGAEAEVSVLAQGVQAKNNPIPEGGNVSDITGWPQA